MLDAVRGGDGMTRKQGDQNRNPGLRGLSIPIGASITPDRGQSSSQRPKIFLKKNSRARYFMVAG